MVVHVVVDRLNVVAGPAATPIVRDVGFQIARGEVLALIGESGSGKTTIALSLMGYARPGCRIAGGSVRLGDTEVLALPRRALASLRGRRVSYIAQSAAGAFNPSKRIMTQVVESALIHGTMSRTAAEAKAVALFGELALPAPDTIGQRFPHQVSGGQLQRLLAAMALITDPELVIMDEPTTALDVTTQIEVLRAFKKVVRERHTTAVYVSHDLAVVAQMADRIVVLRDGEMRETGATGTLLEAPRNDYTRSLLAAVKPTPRAASPTASADDAPALTIRGIEAGYGGIGGDGRPRVPVLSGIDAVIPRGSTLGVIGESGSGKSTLARVAAGLLPAASGEILLRGASLPASAADRSRDQLRRVQIVFQSADTALNPARPVSRILGRPLSFYHGHAGADLEARVRRLLDLVKLPAGIADRYPGELSGGQKQRVNFARALAAEPDIILCDEVTSALDTVVAAAVLDLLAELRKELGLAYMFISHDLSTVRAICDRIMILYAGRMVETGPRAAVLAQPRHPYTDLLISSVPELRTGWLDSLGVRAVGEAAAASGAPVADSCAFFERCAVSVPGLCDRQRPPLNPHAKGAIVACHRSEADLAAAQLPSTRSIGAVASLHGS